jgi:RNA exonuclease 1
MPAIEMKAANFPIHPVHLHDKDDFDPTYVYTTTSTKKVEKKVIIGMDCEMCLTTKGNEVTRVTLVDFRGETLLDELVRPPNPIINYLTRWSGITEERLRHTTTTLETIQKILLQIIDSNIILVGHSLECDLHALRLAHPYVIDTSVIYNHTRGPPSKPSLKWLTYKWLDRRIQVGTDGHDSAEDATACVDLLKLKCKKGLEFGLFNTDFEMIFSRFKRKGIDSAVVNSGRAGSQNFGDGVRTCTNVESDEEVVTNILEALEIEHNFVWSRMRGIELAAGDNDDEESIPSSPIELEPALTAFDANLRRLWEGLPRCTALIVVTGTGNKKEMRRLNANRRQSEQGAQDEGHDQASIAWTDGDDQDYMNAIDKTRNGLGFVAIK